MQCRMLEKAKLPVQQLYIINLWFFDLRCILDKILLWLKSCCCYSNSPFQLLQFSLAFSVVHFPLSSCSLSTNYFDFPLLSRFSAWLKLRKQIRCLRGFFFLSRTGTGAVVGSASKDFPPPPAPDSLLYCYQLGGKIMSYVSLDSSRPKAK